MQARSVANPAEKGRRRNQPASDFLKSETHFAVFRSDFSIAVARSAVCSVSSVQYPRLPKMRYEFTLPNICAILFCERFSQGKPSASPMAVPSSTPRILSRVSTGLRMPGSICTRQEQPNPDSNLNAPKVLD